MIKQYRKKPVVITAVLLDDDVDLKDVMEWCGGTVADHDDTSVLIETLEGVMKANKGDYIIRGVKGEFYPCKPDIFEASYEEVK